MLRDFFKPLKIRFNNKGFTLVELAVVLAIIAIMAAIAIPTYTGIKNQAYESEAVGIIEEIRIDAFSKYIKHNDWPTSVTTNDYDTTNWDFVVEVLDSNDVAADAPFDGASVGDLGITANGQNGATGTLRAYVDTTGQINWIAD